MLLSLLPLVTLALSVLPPPCRGADRAPDTDRRRRGAPDKDGYWNKFRDEVEEDYIRSWPPVKSPDQGLDGAGDPCLKLRCPPHNVCLSRDSTSAVCIRKKPPPAGTKTRKERVGDLKRGPEAGAHGKCRVCSGSRSSAVCGSDGHTYSSKCKMDAHSCLSGKEVRARCAGPCPCLHRGENHARAAHRTLPAVCSDRDLHSLASRLKQWFGVLHLDANRDLKASELSDSAQGRFDTSILPICKDSLGWMFNKLDVNFDLLLDQSELSTLYLDKYERCMQPLFNSCDSFKDGQLSNNEWCYCFQKPEGLPCQNEKSRVQLGRHKSLIGAYLPRCTEVGYFKPTQCHGSVGQCWCVDKYGNELAGSRRQGNPGCDEEQETSGDSGSGGVVVLLDDREEAEPAVVGGAGRQQKKKRGRGQSHHHRRAVDDDEDNEDDDNDKEEEQGEMGYIW